MKRLLLDTHVLIWWLLEDKNLSQYATDLIADAANDVYVSAASIWEISIKMEKGLLNLPEQVFTVIEREDFIALPMTAFHAEQAGKLPKHHHDPFDRMLIAQAQAEGLILITADANIPLYGIRTLNPSTSDLR
ncbi:MAG: type II toxin-antitoxin system VapC family toxin [Neisseria sp.]|nr:type II toxin-antitoxin system VapC family toxin [Neisseria sp.]